MVVEEMLESLVKVDEELLEGSIRTTKRSD